MADTPTAADPTQDNRAWYEKLGNWFQHQYSSNIENTLGKTTEDMATKIAGSGIGKKFEIDVETAKGIIPVAIGGAAAVTGWLLLEPIQKLSTSALSLVKWVITGGGTARKKGLLEKIPGIGGLFTGAGDIVAGAGEYVGYALPVLAGFIGYSMLKTPEKGREIHKPEALGGLHGATPNPYPLAHPEKDTVVNLPDGTKGVIKHEDVPFLTPIKPDDKANPEELKMAKENANIIPDSLTSEIIKKREGLWIKDPELDKALEAILREKNQLYVNIREWVPAAEKFRNGPRKRLIELLKKRDFSDAEAEAFVPNPPKLPPTINPDGDFPKELLEFKDKFLSDENGYGTEGPKGVKSGDYDHANKHGFKELFTYSEEKRQTPRPKKWEEMNLLQKHQFFEQAIAFVEERYKFFEKLKRRTITVSGAEAGSFEYENYDYKDRTNDHWYTPDSNLPNLQGINGIDVKKEHEIVKKLCGSEEKSSSDNWGTTRSYYESGNKLKETLAQWEKQLEHLDEHQLALFKAKPEIASFERSHTLMQQAIHEYLNKGKPVIIGHYNNKNGDFVEVKDCRDPHCPQSLTFCFQKQTDGSYKLNDWKNAIWQNDQVNGGGYYSNMKWQQPQNPVSLTEAQFQELINSGNNSIADTLVDAQTTLKKGGIAIANIIENRLSPSFVAVDREITIADNRDPKNPLQHVIIGSFENGKFIAKRLKLEKENHNLPANENVINDIDDPKAWTALLDKAATIKKDLAAEKTVNDQKFKVTERGQYADPKDGSKAYLDYITVEDIKNNGVIKTIIFKKIADGFVVKDWNSGNSNNANWAHPSAPLPPIKSITDPVELRKAMDAIDSVKTNIKARASIDSPAKPDLMSVAKAVENIFTDVAHGAAFPTPGATPLVAKADKVTQTGSVV